MGFVRSHELLGVHLKSYYSICNKNVYCLQRHEKSKKHLSKEHFLCNTIFPSLRRTGCYDVNQQSVPKDNKILHEAAESIFQFINNIIELGEEKRREEEDKKRREEGRCTLQ